MPDFDAKIEEGATLTAYEDAATPPRSNTIDGLPIRYWRVGDLSTDDIVFGCIVDGLGDRPLDSALGGRLFEWWWVTWPGFPTPLPGGLPTIVPTASQSSEATIPGPDGDVDWRGHWTIGVRRTSGGAVLIPFDVEVTA